MKTSRKNDFLPELNRSPSNSGENDVSSHNSAHQKELLKEENEYLKKRIIELQEMNSKLLEVCDTHLLLPRDEIHLMYQSMYVDDYKREVTH